MAFRLLCLHVPFWGGHDPISESVGLRNLTGRVPPKMERPYVTIETIVR